jgi:Cu2+-exporting ATPase
MSLDKFCKHCELKVFDETSEFCCLGCQNAYHIIKENNLGNYYQFKQNNAKIRNLKPDDEQILALENFINKDENGNNEILLAIDGLHCAACVWLIESILKKQENVVLARVNLSKKYLRLKWQGDGLKLVNLVQKLGYNLFPFDEEILVQEEKKYNNELVKSLAVAGFGAGNVMLFSIALWFYDATELGKNTKDFLNILCAIITLPCIIYSSRVFFKEALKAIKARRSNMDIAISVAIFLTSITSFYQALNHAKHIYFDSAMMLCFFLLIGKWLDFKARKKSFDIAKEFSLINANYARIIDENGAVKIISAKDIRKNMVLLVVAGEKIAADGILIDEVGEIDNSIISGETLPKKIAKNHEVFAGAINLGASIKIKVIKDQQQSLISKIKDIIEEAQSHKNKYEKIADKLAKFYVPFVHILAIFTFIFWYFIKNSDGEISLLNAIAVLIITCPCALALAVPITQSLSISVLLKNGVLSKSGEALEKINAPKIFVFDKTGSLTYGKPKIVDFKCLNRDLNDEESLFYQKIATSIALKSKHPVCAAFGTFYEGAFFDLNVEEKKGSGLISKLNDFEIKLGNAEFIENDLCKNADKNRQKVFLSYKNDVLAFYYEDALKQDAKEVIVSLKKMGKTIILLSGDEKIIVEKTAKNLGIDEFYYQKNPLEKIAVLKKLDKFVMIGDGFNDSACLALSDVSISFLSACDLTKNSADFIIQNEKLTPIIDLILCSEKGISLIKQNLFFALFYNLTAIPFAFFGFISPLIAALAMSLSSIIVVLNSLRILKRK